MHTDFRDRIREIYIAYLEGHFQYLLHEVVHDEIEFSSNAPTLAFPCFAPGDRKVRFAMRYGLESDVIPSLRSAINGPGEGHWC